MSEVLVDALVLQIANRLRDLATRQGRIPFYRGDLRKSIYARLISQGTSAVGSNLPYARAVHDGRPQITIRPKAKRALSWPGARHPVRKVVQPPRKGKPFFREAIEEMQREGFDWLKASLFEQINHNLSNVSTNKIVIHVSL